MSPSGRQKLLNYFKKTLEEFGILEDYNRAGGDIALMRKPLVEDAKRVLYLSFDFARAMKNEEEKDRVFPSRIDRRVLPSSFGLGTKEEQYKSLGFTGSYATHEAMRRK